jgi:type II secretory pathway component PulJ
MNELSMMVAYVAPMSIVAGAAWRIAVKLSAVESRLKHLESENRALKSDVLALRTLLSILVDSRRASA